LDREALQARAPRRRGEEARALEYPHQAVDDEHWRRGVDVHLGLVTTSGEVESSNADPTADASSTQSSSTGPEVLCGNAELDPGEMCDGTPGCEPDGSFQDYACNPLNGAACVEPLRCGLFDFATEMFACMPPGSSGLGGVCGRAKRTTTIAAWSSPIFNTQTCSATRATAAFATAI
jgi:hypothetical protein